MHDIIERIHAIKPEKGDIIVIKTAMPLTTQQYDRLKQHVQSVFPHNRIVLVEPGIDISIKKSQ